MDPIGHEVQSQLSGLRGYVEAIRLFSRNARLYLAHIVGMDLIHGTWEVLFNLYLLAVGFGIEFIGLRLLIGGIASSVASFPAGLISDRIGRKWSFIIGDGGGAAVALGSYLGSRMMAAGDYHTPFVFMAAFYGVSTGLFWIFFKREEERLAEVQALRPS